jgi:hypothetical protein
MCIRDKCVCMCVCVCVCARARVCVCVCATSPSQGGARLGRGPGPGPVRPAAAGAAPRRAAPPEDTGPPTADVVVGPCYTDTDICIQIQIAAGPCGPSRRECKLKKATSAARRPPPAAHWLLAVLGHPMRAPNARAHSLAAHARTRPLAAGSPGPPHARTGHPAGRRTHARTHARTVTVTPAPGPT